MIASGEAPAVWAEKLNKGNQRFAMTGRRRRKNNAKSSDSLRGEDAAFPLGNNFSIHLKAERRESSLEGGGGAVSG